MYCTMHELGCVLGKDQVRQICFVPMPSAQI